jgi:hypothetical protein
MGLSKIGNSGIQNMHDLKIKSQIKKQQEEAELFLQKAQKYQVMINQQLVDKRAKTKGKPGAQGKSMDVNTLFHSQEMSMASLESKRRKKIDTDRVRTAERINQPYQDD